MMLWRRSIGILQNCARKDVSAIGFKRLIDHSLRVEYVAARLSNDKMFSGSTAGALQDISQTSNRISELPIFLGEMTSKELQLSVVQKYNHGLLPEVLPCPTSTYMNNSGNRIRMKSLQDMVVENFHSMESDDYLDLVITTLRSLVEKIWRFHRSQITHGNLKPENVFMCNGECTLTNLVNDGSDSSGWKAPEQLLSYTRIKASDMFSFGCVLYFCITGGCHPFGDDPNQRSESILQNKVNLFQVEDIPEAFDLISLLLSPNPESRLKANEVASHPLFMNLYCKTNLLEYVCCFVNQDKELAEGLKSTIPTLADPNWRDTTMRSGRYILYMAKFQIKLQNVFGSPRSPGFLSRAVLRIYKQHKHEKWFIRQFVCAEDHLERMDDEEYCDEIDEYSCNED